MRSGFCPGGEKELRRAANRKARRCTAARLLRERYDRLLKTPVKISSGAVPAAGPLRAIPLPMATLPAEDLAAPIPAAAAPVAYRAIPVLRLVAVSLAIVRALRMSARFLRRFHRPARFPVRTRQGGKRNCRWLPARQAVSSLYSVSSYYSYIDDGVDLTG